MSCQKNNIEIDYDPAHAVGKSEKVYPSAVKGKWRRFKWWLTAFLLGIYYIAPFIRFDRGVNRPDQAFLVDLDAPRIFLLWIEIYPQEIYYLTAILLIGAIIMFATANVFGRLWCGFLCIQTVWTDIFWAIERWVEGERSARIRMDKSNLSVNKFIRRTIKYILWVLVSIATGGAWVMYFVDAPTFIMDAINFNISYGALSMVILFSSTTFIFAGFAQGRICKYMCPWGRFQSSMFNSDTLQVYYRGYRGEPRQKGIKNLDSNSRGDCIDCDACVRVCPMGIDIRDGLQIDCIGCALCIDACDEIMDKVDLKRGLIAFDTENNMMNKRRGDNSGDIKVINTRSKSLGALILVIVSLFIFSTLGRSTLDLTASINRSPLYVLLKDGSIRNRYTLKVENRLNTKRTVSITLIGLKEYSIKYNGVIAKNGVLNIDLPQDNSINLDVFITVPKVALSKKSMKFTISVRDHRKTENSEEVHHDAKFYTPK